MAAPSRIGAFAHRIGMVPAQTAPADYLRLAPEQPRTRAPAPRPRVSPPRAHPTHHAPTPPR
jgi:hypothetical protein